MSVVGGAAGGEGGGAAGCNDKNKNPTIECGEQKNKHKQNKQTNKNKETIHKTLPLG